ncbi:MAG: carbohydrate ABC transporter permease, partial [bacterium]|nr:carbohydrate ABC transporter permease [bacterium]
MFRNVEKLKMAGIYCFLLTFIFFSLFPALWMLNNSFKTDEEIFTMPPVWFPSIDWENYRAIFTGRPFLKYTLNSLMVSLSVTAICVGLGTPAAYGFSRFQFKGNKLMFGLILASRLVPPISFIVPFTIIFSYLKLIDTLVALIIAYIFFNLPFVIWILSGFFESIPQELDEAARIDGCNNISTFWRVILPLTLPGIIASAILAFLLSWNEFMFALVLTRLEAKTLPIGMYDFFADGFVRWNWLSAATMYSMVPAIIFV